MITPTAPNSMDEFLGKAKNFVQQEQAQGKDPIETAAGLNFMYGLTQQNITGQNTQAQTALTGAQAKVTGQGEWTSIPGTMNSINNVTGEIKKTALVNPTADLGVGAPAPNPGVPSPSVPAVPGASGKSSAESFFQSWQPQKAATYQSTVNNPSALLGGFQQPNTPQPLLSNQNSNDPSLLSGGF